MEPDTRKRSRLAVIIGSIVGGLLLLGLTFGSGVAVGWWIGASSEGPAMHGPRFEDGQLPRWDGSRPGDPRGQDDQSGQEDQTGS